MAGDREYYLDCIERGIALYWRALGSARGLEVHRGDVEYVLSPAHNGPERIYNIRLAAETLDRRLDEIIALIRSGAMPDGFLMGPRTMPPDLPQRLAERGFRLDTSSPCMALDLASLPAVAPEHGPIRTLAVEDEPMLRRWVEIVNSALFGFEIISLDQFHDIYALGSTRLYLALDDGSPAATAMTVAEGDIATLEFVSTLPERRRRGLGTAVTLAALDHLRGSGVKTVSLRAEPMAVGMYGRVGFVEYCRRIVAQYDWGREG